MRPTLITDFLHQTQLSHIPSEAQAQARICLIDLLAASACGTMNTRMSAILRNHAVAFFAPAGFQGKKRVAQILFDGREVSPLGAAMAGAGSIDSIDIHDGQKLTKGHVGCGILPSLLAFCQAEGQDSASEFLCSLILGYEIGSRAGIALHRGSADYHTSGAWVAVGIAAIGARLLKLNSAETEEAMGIAEYHGPRSQMMRCIAHPTMVKDGSALGAMAGVSAAYLAADGFSGAPAITIKAQDVADIWQDLGQRWYICEQYRKLYPVCRWAQPAIAAVQSLLQLHALSAESIARIDISTFHEGMRLALRHPQTTEQAQYSLPFPLAAIICRGKLGAGEISGDSLKDQQINRLSDKIHVSENPAYNRVFPQQRLAHARITLKSGESFASATTQAEGDPENSLTLSQIKDKFFTLCDASVDSATARKILSTCEKLATPKSQEESPEDSIQPLINLIMRGYNYAASAA